MAELLELWDVGEESNSRFPNLGKTSTSRVLRALVLLGGQLRASHIVNEGTRDVERQVVYRIALPVGNSVKFEDLTGYPLTRPENIGVA